MRVTGFFWTAALVVAFGGSATAQPEKKNEPSKADDGTVLVDIWEVVETRNGREVSRSGVFKEEVGAKAYKAQQEKFVDPVTKKSPFGDFEIVKSQQRMLPARGSSGTKPPTLEENTRPKGGVITKPELKTVDPGAMKTGGKAKSLAGMSGTGEINGRKVTVTFTGKDGKGKFKVEGELVGEGEWQQDGTGIRMESQLSTFRGVIKGDKLAGFRFTKKLGQDGNNTPTEWSVDLSESPKSDILIGVWTVTSDRGWINNRTIKSDGTFIHEGIAPNGVILKYEGAWKMDNGKVVFTTADPKIGTHSRDFDGTKLEGYNKQVK